MSSGS